MSTSCGAARRHETHHADLANAIVEYDRTVHEPVVIRPGGGDACARRLLPCFVPFFSGRRTLHRLVRVHGFGGVLWLLASLAETLAEDARQEDTVRGDARVLARRLRFLAGEVSETSALP